MIVRAFAPEMNMTGVKHASSLSYCKLNGLGNDSSKSVMSEEKFGTLMSYKNGLTNSLVYCSKRSTVFEGLGTASHYVFTN